MSRELKKLLLLSVVAFALSGYFLYTVGVFDFWNNDEVIDDLQELNNDIIQTEIVEDIPEEIVIENFSGESIWVVLPKYFEGYWFSDIQSELEKVGLNVEYSYVINNSDYFTKIQNWELSDSDILLVPLDFLDSMDVSDIDMETQISSFFDESISWNDNIFKRFIPFAVDPTVLVVNKNSTITNTDIYDLLAYSLLWESDKALSFPIMIPNHISDENVLESWDSSFENQIILKEIFEKEINDLQNNFRVEDMQDLANMTGNNFYDSDLVVKLVDSISKDRGVCRWFSGICLLSYNFADMKFWFWSDVEIMNLYFQNTPAHNNVYLARIPSEDWTYPVRLRWFVANTNTAATQKFLQEYIKQGNKINWEYLWSVLLKDFENNNFIDNLWNLELVD